MARYTTSPTASGTYEIFDEGKRIATGTKQIADQYLAQNAPQETPDEMKIRVGNQGKPGYDVFGNPVAGATPVRRYTSDTEALFNKPGQFGEEDAQAIRDRTAAEMQARIKAVEDVYAGLIGEERTRGEERSGRTRAIGARGGLTGSPRGEAQAKKTEDLNTQMIRNLEAQKGAEIAAIYDRIDERAEERITAERARIEGEQEKYLAFLEKNRTQALEDLKVLGSAGYTLDDLDKNDVADLLSDTGLGSEVLLEAYMNANRPKELQTNYQYRYDESTGKILAYGVDPKTGQLKTLEAEAGTPKPSANSKLQQFPDGRLAWVDEEDKSIEFLSGVNVAKPEKPEDLSKDETALRKEFNQLPEVKQFGDLQRSYRSANQAYEAALAKNATSGSKAAADQALVTLFNKMLDPTSVVREGEYARSFQGQSALARVQGYVEQTLEGGAGLTDSNRKDMVDIAKRLFTDAEGIYNDSRSFYEDIAKDSGLNPGKIFKPITSISDDVKAAAKAAGYDEAEVDQLREEGYDDEQIMSIING